MKLRSIELSSNDILDDAQTAFCKAGHSQMEWVHCLTAMLIGNLLSMDKEDAVPKILIALIVAGVFSDAREVTDMISPANYN